MSGKVVNLLCARLSWVSLGSSRRQCGRVLRLLLLKSMWVTWVVNSISYHPSNVDLGIRIIKYAAIIATAIMTSWPCCAITCLELKYVYNVTNDMLRITCQGHA